MNQSLLCIMGPTACGKTDLALQLCEQYPFEIISVDSAMVYRGMNIGTAKPSQDILNKVPHHLVNILEPSETYSAADFCRDAKNVAQDILNRGKIPLLVGGTMLYFKALQQGLSELPSADSEIRERILQKAAIVGWQAMHDKLKEIDPKAATRIHPNDPQRIERALEVYYITGKSLSEHFADSQNFEKNKGQFRYCNIGLFPQKRELLHQRIAIRFQQMIKEGWIEEVKLLLHQGLDISSPVMRMVGYRQIALYLTGEIDEQAMIEQGIVATRQLAKRQMTWLRSWPEISLVDPLEQKSIASLVYEKFMTF